MADEPATVLEKTWIPVGIFAGIVHRLVVKFPAQASSPFQTIFDIHLPFVEFCSVAGVPGCNRESTQMSNRNRIEDNALSSLDPFHAAVPFC
jgi:hypothetical protein